MAPWPNDDLATDGLDQDSDRPPRPMFLRLFQRMKEMIAARGQAGGVAELGADGRVPGSQIGRGAAGGVASLAAEGTVPVEQLPAGTAGGVAGLDAAGKVPPAQLPEAALAEPVSTVESASDTSGQTSVTVGGVVDGTTLRLSVAVATTSSGGGGSSPSRPPSRPPSRWR